jgi:hypothetical protein
MGRKRQNSERELGKGRKSGTFSAFNRTKAESDELSPLPVDQDARVPEKDESGVPDFPLPWLWGDVQRANGDLWGAANGSVRSQNAIDKPGKEGAIGP